MILFPFANKMLLKIRFWREISVERSHLGKMSDDQLKDIGISKSEAVHEANRPFWDTTPLENLRRQNKHLTH